MLEKINLKEIIFELLMYTINTLTFFVGVLVYVYLINNNGLPTVLDAYINDESPYWIFGVIILYIPVASFIYYKSTRSDKDIYRKMLSHISDYIHGSLLGIGSSLSGVMSALALFLYFSNIPEDNALVCKAVLLALACFFIFFASSVGFKWTIKINRRNSK